MNDEEKKETMPEQPAHGESLSGDEGHDEPAPPITEEITPSEHTSEPLPVDNAEDVALSGDGSPQPLIMPVVDVDDKTTAGSVSADEDTSQTGKPEAGETVADATEKPKRASALLPVAVIVAILVGLVMIGLSYAVYISSNDKDEKETTTDTTSDQQPNTSQEQVQPLSDSNELQGEVDAISSEIEGAGTDSDFDASSLTDEALEIQ